MCTQAVANFEGAVIVVSHNQHWMEEVGIDYSVPPLDMDTARDTFRG